MYNLKMNIATCKIIPRGHASILSFIPLMNQHNLFSDVSPKLKKEIEESYRVLSLPLNSSQEDVKRAFVELAKKYHPDSGSLEANIDKFVAAENAFRILTKHHSDTTTAANVEKMVFDIKHIAPQHRQYLSFEGQGHGTVFQRMKQHSQARAQRAAENVLEHKINKAGATETTLLKKESNFFKKNTVKEQYGMERLVEDLIMESMQKGDFDNLSGSGKPLKDQNSNPYVDFTTHKLNEVLINNGFTPSWITMKKEIEDDIITLKAQIEEDRSKLGPCPLSDAEAEKWNRICENYRDLAKSLNTKINTFNLIVPSMLKQKFHINVNHILDDILNFGKCRTTDVKVRGKDSNVKTTSNNDLISTIFKLFWK